MREQRTHPIAVVSRKTGLSAHVIRAWEKRYAVVTPARTKGNHRLYTDAEVERLLLLRQAVSAGRSIGQIAALSNEELRELIGKDSLGHAIVSIPDGAPVDLLLTSKNYIRECMEAVKKLDSRMLSEILYRSSIALGQIAIIEQVVTSLMQEIGEYWSEGSLRILHEHMASAVVRTYLGDLLRSLEITDGALRGVATTLAGERHELGILTAAVAAAFEGWHVEYLGPNLPWEEIARAAELFKATVVMISMILSPDESKALSEIEKLRKFSRERIVILVGGQLSSSQKGLIEQAGAEWLDSIRDLRTRLHSISTESADHPQRE
jgi:DNA-binding transcriptional MerR regulator/methylmalonyl-CoA mutase cobalamin-binding subunit